MISLITDYWIIGSFSDGIFSRIFSSFRAFRGRNVFLRGGSVVNLTTRGSSLSICHIILHVDLLCKLASMSYCQYLLV